MHNLVSIIIPNYNRASLIGETLDSILAQSYKNWECIIVDDGSTDHSLEVINKYVEKDNRFLLHERPKDYPKGANACRNIGMRKSQGDYVIFFDSDDLMTEHHIEVKLSAILSQDYDFVVTRTKYFNNPNNDNPINYRNLGKTVITAESYITKEINWLTLDPIIKTEVARTIAFTEKNQSAEEYNYFVKLLLQTERGVATNDITSLRRYHEQSYQVGLNDEEKRLANKFHYYFDTYQDIKDKHTTKKSKQYLIRKAAEAFYINNNLTNKKIFYKEIIKTSGLLKGLRLIKIIETKS